ncbi:transposase [Bdellovibrionota bacterium FG-2]
MKQLSFLPKLRIDHGGALLKGRRKEARPFSHKHAIHLVLRSTKATKAWSMLTPKNEARVNRILSKCAAQYHIRVYKFANVGNHLHLLVKTETKQYTIAKQELHSFLRRFAGEIAFQITGAKKGEAFRKNERDEGFWDKLLYSRLVTWGREYDAMKKYLAKNFLETFGVSREIDAGLRAMVLGSLRAAGFAPP